MSRATFPLAASAGCSTPEKTIQAALAGLLEMKPPTTAGEWIRRMEGALDEAGWTVERRGQTQTPRPMAQLGAVETANRQIVLYLPFLRWISIRWDDEVARGLFVHAMPADSWTRRLAVLTESERIDWTEALALTHEFVHALQADSMLARRLAEVPGGAEPACGGSNRQEAEGSAHRLVSLAAEYLWNTTYDR